MPDGAAKLIALRWFLSMVANCVEQSVVKYISLVFCGIARNLTPIATIILSFILTGERFKQFDIVFILVSLCAVTMVTIGIANEKHEPKKDDLTEATEEEATGSFLLGVAAFSALAIPLATAYGNIIMRQLKGLHK